MDNISEQTLSKGNIESETRIDCDSDWSTVEKGVSAALRYIRTYQFVSLAGLNYIYKMDGVNLQRTPTDVNDSDFLTKPLPKDKLR